MELNEITNRVIGAGILVHKELGPGLLESIYEECLVYELQSNGMSVIRQKEMPIVYRGVKLNCNYRLDLVVEDRVIVELKCAKALDEVFTAQMLTYLKITGHTVGLIMNFNVPVLKQGIRRVVRNYTAPQRLSG